MANPAVGLGYKSYLQFGRESAYGTGVAATHKLDLMEADVKLSENVIRDESFYGDMSRQILYQGGYSYKGKIKVRCQYEGLAMLLDWVFGSDTYGSAGGADSGPVSGIYTHAFTLRQYLNSYTVEIIEADMPTGKCFQLIGTVCTGLTVTGGSDTAGQMLTVELDILAKDKLSNATPTGALKTPEISLGAYTPVLFYQTVLASSIDGTADTPTGIRIKNFTFALMNGASENWYLGSQTIDQPVRNAWVDAKWTITQQFLSRTLYDAARTFADGHVKLVFNDTRSPAPRVLELNSTLAKLIDYSPPINKYGIIESTANWEAYGSGSVNSSLGNTKATVSTAYA